MTLPLSQAAGLMNTNWNKPKFMSVVRLLTWQIYIVLFFNVFSEVRLHDVLWNSFFENKILGKKRRPLTDRTEAGILSTRMLMPSPNCFESCQLLYTIDKLLSCQHCVLLTTHAVKASAKYYCQHFLLTTVLGFRLYVTFSFILAAPKKEIPGLYRFSPE